MDTRSKVAEAMTTTVVTTTPDARLDEAARSLRVHHISGLPVVDPARKVVGMLSERDIVRALHSATGVDSARGLLDLLLGSAPPKGESMLEVCRRQLHNTRVAEAMTSQVVTVEHDAPLEEVARRMRLHEVKRLPVVDGRGNLVGIVTRADVVHAISGGPSPHRGGLRPRPSARPAAGSGPFEDA